MAIDYDSFYKWCVERFGSENLKIRHTINGDEICTHSFIAEQEGMPDHKYHLWMNPNGGKTGSTEYGAWRCWYSEKFGTLVGLVSKVDNIPFDEAEELICDSPSLRTLEEKVHEFFGHKTEEVVELPKKVNRVELPEYTYLIDELSNSNYWKIQTKMYLNKRKLSSKGLYICTDGEKYKNRIVIPYCDQEDRLRFYNCRTLSKNKKVLRYRKCEESSQEEVLYFHKWPRRKAKIYITEGEFDAISLNLAGFFGCACGGKYLSDDQAEIIRENGFRPVLAFDADATGREAVINIGEKLLSMGFIDISYIRPPTIFKDWNNMLVERNEHVIRAYVERFEKRYTVDTMSQLKANTLL